MELWSFHARNAMMLDHSSNDRDPLSQMLLGLRLEGVDYTKCRMKAPWGLDFPAQSAAYFHLVTEAPCWLREPSGRWVALAPGDAVLFPRGTAHRLASAPEAEAAPFAQCPRTPLCCAIAETRGGGDGLETLLFGGNLAFNLDADHPLLRMMPDLMWVHDLAMHEPAIPSLLATMTCELTLDRVGSAGIVTRLADVVAAALIRTWIEKGCGEGIGWVAAARDPHLGRVLAAIHLEPTRDWTVEALASLMGASRSGFAERFAAVVGQTPARYVAQVKMHQARQWLAADRLRIGVVAQRLGYESEASFSRAFKRITGLAPSQARVTGKTEKAVDRRALPGNPAAAA